MYTLLMGTKRVGDGIGILEFVGSIGPSGAQRDLGTKNQKIGPNEVSEETKEEKSKGRTTKKRGKSLSLRILVHNRPYV